jgi:multisubunit Na+/H+ antiporter MnhC subunit
VILYSALVFAAVFASGTYLLLQRDLTRVIVGIILVSN